MFAVVRNYVGSFNSLNSEAKKLLLLYLVRSVSTGMTFFISIFLAHVHMKVSIIGLEVSAIAIGNMMGAWLAAKFSDKFNPYSLSSRSLLVQGMCFITIAHLKNPLILAGVIFLNGIASYFYISVSSYLITSAAGGCEKDRAKAIGFKTVMSNLGLGVGGVLISLCSQQYAYFSFMSIGLILFLLSYCYVRSSKELVKQQEKKAELVSSDSNQSLLTLSLFSVGLMGIIIGIQRVGMQFFYEENFSSSYVSFVIILNSLIIILFMPSVINYLKNKNHIFFLGIGGFFLGVGTSLHIFCSTFLVLTILCFVRTFGEMLMAQESEYLCFQSAANKEKGRALGRYKLIFSLGTTIGAVLSGEMLEIFGLNSVWDISALLGFISLSICFIYTWFTTRRFGHLA